MFGNLNKPAFGSTAPSTSFGFGATSTSTANPFGQNQNLFGKPATGVFGSPSTSTFGQPSNTIFPSTQPQQTNLFQNANTTFGAAPTTQSGFGSNLFGQPQQPASSSGLFPSSTSTFGQQNKPTGFGFGTQQTQPNLFGQQPQQQSNIFQPAGSTLFGQTSNAFAGQTGTVIKFNPVTGTDTMMKNSVTHNINTKHHSITCMKEYENKSFEELRWEDYQANRKGPQQQQMGFGGTAFGGTPASSAPSLFGQSTEFKPAFGQSTGFGATTSAFGQNTTGGFGMTNQTATTGPFGGKPTAFGAPTSTTNTFGFGNTAQANNPFGANQNKPFGSTTQPIFGQNTTTTQPSTGFGTGMFGQTNTQNTGTDLFGKPAQPTTGFGATGQTSNFNFSTPASTQSTNLFGNTNKSLFGQTGTTTGFGMQSNTGQSAFGSTFNKPAASAFGTTQQTGFGTTLGGQNQSTSMFGNTQNKPVGLFGNTSTTGLFGSTTTNFNMGSSGFGLGQPQQQQQQSLFPTQGQNESPNLALMTSDPFGDAPHLAGLEPKLKSTASTAISATDPRELKSLLDASKKVDMSHNNKLKVIPLKSLKESLFDGVPTNVTRVNNESPLNEYTKTNVRKLVLRAKRPEDSNRPRSNILDVLDSEDKENKTKSKMIDSRLSNFLSSDSRANPVRLDFDSTIANHSLHDTAVQSPTFTAQPVGSSTKVNAMDALGSPLIEELDEDLNQAGGDAGPKKHPTGIVCTRHEYYTLPSLDELTQYVDENGRCLVKGFTIGRKGYGNVYFPDEMDVSNLNIDEIVHFRYREINIYPDDAQKPPVGQGLNRRAQVTLDNIYPRTSSNQLIKDPGELLRMNFAEKLRKVTEKKGARFVDYRPETGSWVFKVDHFSRYGFNDSDEESDPNGIDNGSDKNKQVKVPGKDQKAKEVEKKQKDKEMEKEVTKESIEMPIREPTSSKFGLDNEIYVEQDNSSEEDILQQSMHVDHMSDEDYHQIPMEIPMDIHYDVMRSSKNIQVMKTTLFAEDDRSSDDAGSHISIIKQYLDIPDDMEPRLTTIREEPVKKRRPILRPNVYNVYNIGGTELPAKILPSRCCMDLSLYKGKSFKCGWMKGFNFFTLNSMKGEINGEVAMREFNMAKRNDPLESILEKSLQIVLQESSVVVDSDGTPTFTILRSPSYLKKQMNLFEKLATDCACKESDYLYSIWTLCTALWGPSEESIYNRRFLLSEWLKTNTLSDFALKNSQFTSTDEAVASIFVHLSIFKVFEAANIALENRLPNLSLLISQLCLPNPTKMFLQEQIESWYESSASTHISEDLKKIYLLLSGIPSKNDVNVFNDIDWKRAFGMHLWYVCPNGAPVEMAIEQYTKAFKDTGYAVKPDPPYEGDGGPFDILYHILLLYKSNIHRLASTLNPATHTDDPLDYRLSWLLLQLFLSLNVGLIEQSEIIKITTSFSTQLEHLGKWEWAIFVLLHLEDDAVKRKLVTEILDRNLSPECNKTTTASQDNLVNNMEMPPKWIHKVKAEKLLLLDRVYEAFNNFAHAVEYVTSNELLVDRILPELFINEQYDVLKTLINRIKPGSSEIQNWQNEAGLFSEFLALQEQVVSFEEDEIISLQMQLQSIASRVKHFPLVNDQQKLCIAELSKRCASLYKDLCRKSRTKIFNDSYMHLVENLVMPPEFLQSESMHIINEELSKSTVILQNVA